MCVYVCMYVPTYVRMYFMYVCLSVLYVCMYVCMYVCLSVYTCTYKYYIDRPIYHRSIITCMCDYVCVQCMDVRLCEEEPHVRLQ